jgi:hypothetical protein
LAGFFGGGQSPLEIGAAFWETTAEASVNTTAWVLLNQPDKQKLTNRPARDIRTPAHEADPVHRSACEG